MAFTLSGTVSSLTVSYKLNPLNPLRYLERSQVQIDIRVVDKVKISKLETQNSSRD